jgi:DNA-binding XRE family transcriptional regulator
MDAKSLAPIIREWRIECRLTQETLGERAGLNKKIVGAIERGTRATDLEELAKLCRAMEKSPADLIMLWSRSALNNFQRIEARDYGRREEKGAQIAPVSKVDQIIDKIAVLVKELYRESRNESQKIFLDWLAQSGPTPPPSPPKRPRRVSRKR